MHPQMNGFGPYAAPVETVEYGYSTDDGTLDHEDFDPMFPAWWETPPAFEYGYAPPDGEGEEADDEGNSTNPAPLQ